ncbi:phosphatidate cytidylyltransferase [Candidatus Berkiella aquae]|uniref:Phosphatidate cytidylyltransferase n=1 Tax=Candidatus Berkiella aquae TaxID=295108 RepID=A0A0Q9YWU2_9GAMM|nr:phosphatidate cytidylyltransferase [Candidatus Berkiella aquae]MCS5711157.1 phosphatidate cytidylyltransferase [Candidatus Berkiella aquae]
MLKWRILTALILIPFVLWGILSLQATSFAVLSAIILLIGAHEWTALCPFPKYTQQAVFLGCYIAILCLLSYFKQPYILFAALIFWIIAAIGLSRYSNKPVKWLNAPLIKGAIGLLLLPSAWYGLNVIHRAEEGPVWLIICLVIIWATDTFAYFTGRIIGKRPLAPFISPKKTIEGFWGGVIGALLLAFIAFFTNMLPSHHSLGIWLTVVLGTILLAVVGDLFESLMKRLAGVKDSGKLLPGHGGVLDRLDSLIAAAPFFALAMSWIQRSL